MAENERPIILISGGSADTKSIAAAVASVRAMGAVPMLIANHAERLAGNNDPAMIQAQVAADLAKADGVMVMGNNADIDPADYHVNTRHPSTKSERDTPEGNVRALYEYALIEQTLKCKKPLIGICGGMQRLNVLLGGTIEQHVPDLTGNENHQQDKADIAPFVPVQYVQVIEGSKLNAIGGRVQGLFTPTRQSLPPGVTMENSFHHQAVDKIGEGLQAVAYSHERAPGVHIVEAIEGDPKIFDDQFVMGVQWHPEFGASELSGNLLRAFAKESVKYMQAHSRESVAMQETAVSMGSTRWQDWVERTRITPPSGRGAA